MCGLCGCYDPDGTNKWCPGLNFSLFDWGRQHPEQEEKIITEIKKAINWKRGNCNIYGKVDLKGIGKVEFFLSSKGLQVSENDKSCPFFEKDTHKCKLWGTEWLPTICKITPQNLTGENQIKKWLEDHPYCGFSWIKE